MLIVALADLPLQLVQPQFWYDCYEIQAENGNKKYTGRFYQTIIIILNFINSKTIREIM
jgi:hypothetical protein